MKTSPTAANELERPLRTLFLLLPKLQSEGHHFDATTAANDDLLDILQAAETVSDVMNRGVRTLGWMIALESADIEDGTLSASAMEACGWLLAELADTAATCGELAVLCRKQLGNDALLSQRRAARKRANHADSR
jgi:hypothetical protein